MIIKPLPKGAERALLGLTSPLWFPPLAGLFAMMWTGEMLDRRLGPKVGEWQPWYAWWPTKLGTWREETVWLERVERTRIGHADIYRRPGDSDVPDPWAAPSRLDASHTTGAGR